MFRSANRNALLCSVALTAVLSICPAAQAETATGSTNLDEVVVTARRVEENAQTVPVSIVAVNATQIREQGIVSLESLARITPGVVFTHVGTNSNVNFTIRGMSRSSITGGLSTVISYFNDVPLPTLGSALPTFDISNLQVLKGPQGTLFGRNTTGGAVLAYSKRPTYQFGGYVDGKYTSYNGQFLEAAVNIPLIDNKLALRVAALSERRNGYTKNQTGGGDFDDIDDQSYRVSLLFEPTDRLSNVTVADYYKSEVTGAGISITNVLPGFARGIGAINPALMLCGVSPSCDAFLAGARALANPRKEWPTPGQPLYEEVERTGLSNTTTFKVSDNVTVKNILGYRKVDYAAALDSDGSELPVIASNTGNSVQALSEEVNVAGKSFDKKLGWIGGVFYIRETPPGSPLTNLAIGRPFAPGATGNESFYHNISKAAYGNVSYDLSALLPGLRLNGGLRYTKDTVSLCNSVFVLSGTTAATFKRGVIHDSDCRANPANFQAKGQSHAWTYTYGIDWQASDDLFFYATRRRGYRGPGINTPKLAAPGPNVLNPLSSYQQFNPEYLTDIEIGAKTDWRVGDWTGRFNVAAYRGVYTNVQRMVAVTGLNFGLGGFDGDGITSNDPSQGSLVINAGKAVIRGVELSGVVRPTEALSFTFGAAYTEPKWVTFAASIDGVSLNVGGLTRNFYATPRWSASGNVRYALPIDPKHGKLVANADIYYTAKAFFGDLRVAPWSVTDVRLDWNGVEGTPVDVGVFVTNAFDRTYIATTQLTSNSTQLLAGGYGPPRMFGMSLRYHFGAE